MRSSLLWTATLFALMGFAACSGATTSSEVDSKYTDTSVPGGEGGGGLGGGSGAEGLPCDVQDLLAAHCTSCHGAKPSGGASMSLVTYDDLAKASYADPAKSFAERALVRMQDAKAPMPPGVGVTVPADEIAAFKAWVDAGHPKGTCGDMPVDDPFAKPPICTSMKTWKGDEGPLMEPGKACITCHTQEVAQGEEDAPLYVLAGTVYPTGHEPDRCLSPAAQGAVVEAKDADGKVVTMNVNSAGNFFYKGPFKMPYTAKVIFDGKERAMSATQSSGDCNSCHTQNGANNAPGRIVLP